MKVIFSSEKYDVISKYTNHYIRFIGGQIQPIPCDLKISEDEYNDIIFGRKIIDDVIKYYMTIIPWTEEEFIRRGLEDFFIHRYRLNAEEIEEKICKLKNNIPLRNEMYMSIMNESFPIKSWARVKDLTATDYSKKMGTDWSDTYMHMLSLL